MKIVGKGANASNKHYSSSLNRSIGECNTILSAYTKYRSIGT